eukprot:c40402_g1_i1 orf=272-1537(-)
MDSPVQGWLVSKVPGWDDDVMCAARFKALTGQRTDWEGRFLFWRELIIDLARHLNLLVLDTHAVEHSWFLRGGLTPLCINQVLLEMHQRGDLQNLDNLLETESSLSWFWQQIRKGVIWGSSNKYLTSGSIAGRLVVTPLVHERIVEVTKSISENCWTASCVTTMEHLINICGGEEEASIIKRELIRMKRGRTFVTEGDAPIKGFKISLSEDRVSDVSKLDAYMLHLYWTLEKLSAQMVLLEKAYSRSKQSAIRALKQDRITAKRHAQSMHTLAASKLKCTEFQGKIQEVLAFISQAEMTKQVSEAMKVGANALKEHAIPLEDIEACLHELDEAISGHKEVAGVLGSATNGFEVDDLDLQLTELELQVFGEENEAPSAVVENIQELPKPPVPPSLDTVQELPKPTVPSLDTVEQAMESLLLG